MASHSVWSRFFIRCPVCSGRPAHIYRCNHCGEVRCSDDNCCGSESNIIHWAATGLPCHHCSIGHYRILDSAGNELADFIRTYRSHRHTPTTSPSYLFCNHLTHDEAPRLNSK